MDLCKKGIILGPVSKLRFRTIDFPMLLQVGRELYVCNYQVSKKIKLEKIRYRKSEELLQSSGDRNLNFLLQFSLILPDNLFDIFKIIE